MKKFLSVCFVAAFVGITSLHSAVGTLALYQFTHLQNVATPLTANTVGPNMTLSSVSLTGGVLSNSTADRLRVGDTLTASFSTITDFAAFTMTADPGYYFDLTNALSLTRFQVGRVNGSTPILARMQVFGSASGPATASSTLLLTSATGSATSQTMVSIQTDGPFANISSTQQYTSLYVQVQWSTSGTPDSSGMLFDNFRIDGEVIAVPEPSTCALLAGLLTLGGVLLRRRLRD